MEARSDEPGLPASAHYRRLSPTLTTCGVQRTASGAHVRHSSQPRSAVHAQINEIGAMPPCHILQITNQKL
jgi:hypothetical protein